MIPGGTNRVGWDKQTDVLVGRRSRYIVDSAVNPEPTVVRFATAHHGSCDLVPPYSREQASQNHERPFRSTKLISPDLGGRSGGYRVENALYHFMELAAQGRNEEAIDSFRKALAIDPQFELAHYELGVVLAK